MIPPLENHSTIGGVYRPNTFLFKAMTKAQSGSKNRKYWSRKGNAVRQEEFAPAESICVVPILLE